MTAPLSAACPTCEITHPWRDHGDWCPDCGHGADGHDRRSDDRACEECDDAAQLGQYAPCQTVDHIPAGAQPDDDPEAFAAELVALYAAAIERVRDRAQEARYGGRLYRTFANDPRYRPGIDAWARSYATARP